MIHTYMSVTVTAIVLYLVHRSLLINLLPGIERLRFRIEPTWGKDMALLLVPGINLIGVGVHAFDIGYTLYVWFCDPVKKAQLIAESTHVLNMSRDRYFQDAYPHNPPKR